MTAPPARLGAPGLAGGFKGPPDSQKRNLSGLHVNSKHVLNRTYIYEGELALVFNQKSHNWEEIVLRTLTPGS